METFGEVVMAKRSFHLDNRCNIWESTRMRPHTTTVSYQLHPQTSVTTQFLSCNMHPPFRVTAKASPLLEAYHFNYDPAMLACVSGVPPMGPPVPLTGTINKVKQDKRKKSACEICKKMFQRPSALKVHMRIHSGDRPFKCAHCPRTFTQSGNLTVHLRKHSGERPFACTICLKRFSQSNSLQVHIRRHTGEKPYQCGECKKRFADRSTLVKHHRVHEKATGDGQNQATSPGADLGKMLTDLLQNECRRRKLLGGSGGMFPREIFSILTT